MTTPRVVGLDLSLTSTGLAATGTTNGIPYAAVDRITTKPTGDNIRARTARLNHIVDAVHGWVAADTDLVVIEGPALATRSAHTHDRSGLWWLVINRLIANDHPVVIVPPSSRAKYATGKGNAAKDAVLAAVVRRYPDTDVTGNDEADALILAAMGARALGHPIETGGVDGLPKTHLDAMTKIAWPATEGLAA